MAGKFELKMAKDEQFHFILKAGNGRVILASETYRDKRNALAGIESVRKNSPASGRYERKTSARGEPYFVLTAPNGQTIGQSEMYSSPAAMEKGIASVRKNAATARLNDYTE